jgi:hypothetical protein
MAQRYQKGTRYSNQGFEGIMYTIKDYPDLLMKEFSVKIDKKNQWYSKKLQFIEDEISAMRFASSTKIGPKVINITKFKFDGRIYFQVIMERIIGFNISSIIDIDKYVNSIHKKRQILLDNDYDFEISLQHIFIVDNDVMFIDFEKKHHIIYDNSIESIKEELLYELRMISKKAISKENMLKIIDKERQKIKKRQEESIKRILSIRT